MLALSIASLGCGGGGSPQDGGGSSGYNISDYYPLRPGNTWTYVDESAQSVTLTALAISPLFPGQQVMHLHQDRSDGPWDGPWYDLYQTSDSSGLRWWGVKRLPPGGGAAELIRFDPPLKVPNGMSIGETYQQEYVEIDPQGISHQPAAPYSVTLEALDTVLVPAGTFADCLRFRDNWRRRWFPRDTGVVQVGSPEVETGPYLFRLKSAILQRRSHP